MTKIRWMILGLVVVLMIGVQHYGLEREEETRTEAPLKKIPSLKASEVLPTYIASLFFGAFRAVAVDILWIQLRKVEEEKRWYERREIINLISYVQPRNPEVWSHLGWHSAYNVANGFTDPDKSWEWVKFGLLWLRKGITTLPNEPYLKDQLAYTLWHKPSWKDGSLDLDLLRRIEEDKELQAALLPDGMKSDRPLSAFELAIPWLERARDELMTRDFELTQMGLYLYPDSMDGFIRLSMILQGMYEWKKGNTEAAKEWFRKAQRQCEDMVDRAPDSRKPGPKYRNPISSIFGDYAKLYAGYPEMVDLAVRAKSGKPEDERALVEHLQGLLVKYGPIDESWLWHRYDPRAFLNSRKIHLTGGQDMQECNDSFDMSTDLNPGDLALANLAPEGMDVDFYWILVAPPPAPEGMQPRARPERPIPLHLIFKKAPKFELKVSFFDPNRKPVKDMILSGPGRMDVTVAEYGHYFLKVEAAKPDLPWPADTRYAFEYAYEE